MTQQSLGDLQAELVAIRAYLEAQRDNSGPAINCARRRGFSRGLIFGLLLSVVGLLLISTVLYGQGTDPLALFIDKDGNVGIGTNQPGAKLDVDGKVKAKDLDITNKVNAQELEIKGDADVLGTLKVAKKVNAQELETKGDAKVLGTLNVEKSMDVKGTATVAGDIVANNVWVKLHERTLDSVADYEIKGLDGDVYRRFKFELEGIVKAGGKNRTIGVRPNGSTVNYGPGAQHWSGHEPGVTWHNGVGWQGPQALLLPLCVTHWNRDGHVLCTGEMNTRAARFRMITSIDVFNTDGICSHNQSCIMSTRHMNSWRDMSTNITSLTLHFDGAAGFSGQFALYGKK